MGLIEAKKYIRELHKKQEDPFLWPDFLTGLPDKAAIIKRIGEVYPKLGKYAIAYVRIANIHPYLLKYGPDRHAEIIQWAAAILKTSACTCEECFAGALSSHDFIVICKSDSLDKHLRDAAKAFGKIIWRFYTNDDLARGTTLSFMRAGERVHIGLIGLISVIADRKLKIAKSRIIQDMGRVCESLEKSGEGFIKMSDDLIC